MTGQKITIYHNPRCSKSRETLKLLQEEGVEPEVIEYLKDPPSVSELEEILKKLGAEPEAIVRKKEAAFKDLGLDKGLPERKKLLSILHENPVLIERPIVVKGKKAVIGRPPENARELL